MGNKDNAPYVNERYCIEMKKGKDKIGNTSYNGEKWPVKSGQ